MKKKTEVMKENKFTIYLIKTISVVEPIMKWLGTAWILIGLYNLNAWELSLGTAGLVVSLALRNTIKDLQNVDS